MSKTLKFSIGEEVYSAEPTKLDRKKLYGWRETAALDDEGAACGSASMSECGTICIPKGGAGLGMLTPDGKWVTRGQITMINPDGTPAVLVKSSFDTVNVLEEKSSPEDLLNCSVKGFYHLDVPDSMIMAIGGDIYRFEYCFRDSYETVPAFVLAVELDGRKELFMFTGPQHDFPFIGFDEIDIPDESESFEEDGEDGELDFAMF